MAKGFKSGGRQVGSKNKRTIGAMVRASQRVGAIQREGQKRAVEVLNDLMQTSMSFAATYQQRIMAAGPRATRADKEWFFRAMECAGVFAKALAPFQDPRFGTIDVPVAPPAPAEEPKVVEGKVIRLDDPVAVGKVYQQMMRKVG